MFVALAILTGGLVSVMIEANGELQAIAGALPALLAIHLSGLATTGAFAGAAGVGRRAAPLLPLLRRLAASADSEDRIGSRGQPAASDRTGQAPIWFLTAGILGVAAVFLNNEVYRHGGVVLTLMGTLAGQTLSAQLLEGSRWFERRRSPLAQRLLSLLLILPGAILIGLRSGVGVGWILISWLPGGILMVQQMMNTRNAIRFGSRAMLFFNYASALAALGLLSALSPALLAGAIAAQHAPLPLLCGGGLLGVMIVGISSYLFARAPALQVVLGMYAGQIGVGVVLDSIAGRPLAAVNVAGVCMVVLGLVVGAAFRNRRRHGAT